MKLGNKKYYLVIGVVIIVFLLSFNVAWAGVSDKLLGALVVVISFIVDIAIKFFNYFLALSMGWIISLSQYNQFLTNGPVKDGWEIVRDIANMIFVVALLMIAFKTVYQGSQGSNYQWSKSLAKLVAMAVLINFSKFICGLAIDASQVLMMTFVNAFKPAGMGNIQDMLGIAKLQQIYKKTDENESLNTFSNADMVANYVAILVIMFVCLILIFSFVLMLLTRVVALWILVVISPLAFAMMALESSKAQEYAKKWIKTFGNYLVVGPLLAFFIWLSFATFKSTNSTYSTVMGQVDTKSLDVTKKVMASASLQPDNISGLLITIAFMVGGLMAVKELGIKGGELGMSMVNKGRGYVTAKVKKAGGMALGATKKVAGLPLAPIKFGGKLAGKYVGDLKKGLGERAFASGGIVAAFSQKGQDALLAGAAARGRGRGAGTYELETSRQKEKVLKERAEVYERQGRFQTDAMAKNVLEKGNDAEKYGAMEYFAERGELDEKKVEMYKNSDSWKKLTKQQQLDRGGRWTKTNQKESGMLVPIADQYLNPDSAKWEPTNPENSTKYYKNINKNDFDKMVTRDSYLNIDKFSADHVANQATGLDKQSSRIYRMDPGDRIRARNRLDYVGATKEQRTALRMKQAGESDSDYKDRIKSYPDISRKQNETDASYNNRINKIDAEADATKAAMENRGVNIGELRKKLDSTYEEGTGKITEEGSYGDVFSAPSTPGTPPPAPGTPPPAPGTPPPAPSTPPPSAPNTPPPAPSGPAPIAGGRDYKRKTDAEYTKKEDQLIGSINRASKNVGLNQELIASFADYGGAVEAMTEDDKGNLMKDKEAEDLNQAINQQFDLANKGRSNLKTSFEIDDSELEKVMSDFDVSKDETQRKSEIKVKLENIKGAGNVTDQMVNSVDKEMLLEADLKEGISKFISDYGSSTAKNQMVGQAEAEKIIPVIELQVNSVSNLEQINPEQKSAQDYKKMIVTVESGLSSYLNNLMGQAPIDHSAADLIRERLSQIKSEIESKQYNKTEVTALKDEINDMVMKIKNGDLIKK